MPRTIGLMSGTSLDGVDAAWLDTDGISVAAFGPALTIPYDDALRRDLRAILDIARQHPDKTITVLCGHTHHRTVYSPESNLKVQVAGAEYHHPQVADIMLIP